MDIVNQVIDVLGIPGTIAAGIIGVWIILQFIGEICELKGKIVPEFLKIRKYFQRKKAERKQQEEIATTLADVKALLEKEKKLVKDFDSHYSKDNITKRDNWIHWVDNQAKIYDTSIAELRSQLQKNSEITLELFIESKRNFLLDFAGKVADDKYLATREQFNRAFKVHEDYEQILRENNQENGQVTIAYKVITDAYEVRLRDHTFLEDLRGYTKNEN